MQTNTPVWSRTGKVNAKWCLPIGKSLLLRDNSHSWRALLPCLCALLSFAVHRQLLPIRADGQFIEQGLSQSFLEYGLWQNFDTGKETQRGNRGDMERKKVRQKKPWFSRKYYASVMNLRDFLADNMAK